MCRVNTLPTYVDLGNQSKGRLTYLVIKLSGSKFDLEAASEFCNYECPDKEIVNNELGPFDSSEEEFVKELNDLINARSQHLECCSKNNKVPREFWRFLVHRNFKKTKGS